MNIQKRGERLYVNGRRVFLLNVRTLWNRTIPPKHEKATVGTLVDLSRGRAILGDDVLDHLLDHPRLIPRSWKKSYDGKKLAIFFLATKHPGTGPICTGQNYFRCLQHCKQRWTRNGYSEFSEIDPKKVRVAAFIGKSDEVKRYEAELISQGIMKRN